MRAFLLSRRSTKAFRERPVPRELIEQLIEVGTHAGTASNAQTENFIVIQDRRLLSEVEGMVIGILWNKTKPLGSGIGRRLAGIRYGADTVKRSIQYYERLKARRDSGDLDGLIFRNAPAMIAVHGLRANFNARENCAIAVRNMEMLAKSLGLGTCWAGLLLVAAGFTDKIARCLGISDDRNIYSAIMLGYPKHEYLKTIPRRQREVRWL
jgi:nitroreductase